MAKRKITGGALVALDEAAWAPRGVNPSVVDEPAPSTIARPAKLIWTPLSLDVDAYGSRIWARYALRFATCTWLGRFGRQVLAPANWLRSSVGKALLRHGRINTSCTLDVL
jgi:hypothetical protein